MNFEVPLKPAVSPADLHRQDLEAIADALIVRSSTAYLCVGHLAEVQTPPEAAAAPAAPDPSEAPPVLRALENEIYTRFYMRPTPAPPASRDLASHRDFLKALSAANSGAGTWEPGWLFVRREPDGRIVVLRHGVCFWTNADRVRTNGSDPKQNDACRVFVSKELRYLLPGFYYAVGNGAAGDDRDCGAPIVRIYWNLAAGSALRYLDAITGGLNKRDVAFRTKVLSDASAYGRADAGVLYLDRRDLAEAWPTVRATCKVLRDKLGTAAPMFSLKLADGVGLADDPGDGRSFGQARSAVLAQGLWSAFAAGADDTAGRVEAMRAAFLDHDLDPDRPHLSPGAPDYDVSLTARPVGRAAKVRPRIHQ